MHPIAWFIENPVKVAVGVILLVMFGLIALFKMPLQLSPDVERPQITISTQWPGASPQEIENEIVKEQEERLKSVEGVTKMSSECFDSMGNIIMEFRVGTKMDSALLKVNSQLQQVPNYPIDARKPIIRTSNSNDNSIGWFILGPKPPEREQVEKLIVDHPEFKAEIQHVLNAQSVGLLNFRLGELAQKLPAAADLLPPELDMSTYGKFVEDVIEAQLERVPGVADAMVRGGRRPQMQVIVDANRLAARGLTLSDLRSALNLDNRDVSAGDFWEGKRRIVVRTLGQYRSIEQIASQIIATENGQPILVSDVAEVRLGYEKATGFVRRFGVSSMSVSVNRDTGANVMEVMRRIEKEVDRLNRGVLAQRNLVLAKAYDETTYIKSAVTLVQQNIVLGGALTVIILMLFLHVGARTVFITPFILFTALAAIYLSPWYFVGTLALVLISGFWFARGTLIVGIAIPISIIGTFLVLNALQRSLNVISLAGTAFAVGMLVDNAVVVLENIFRYYRMGYSTVEASRRGVAEVWGAVLASTLTTLAVFLPVIFLEGEVGQLFGDIALAISGAVGLSLIVSIIVIPTAATRILSDAELSEGTVKKKRSQIALFLEAGAGAVANWISGLNVWLQRNWFRRFATVGVIMTVSTAVGLYYFPKVEYLPSGNRNLIFCNIMTPPGYNAQQLNEIGLEVERLLRPYWDIEPATEDVSKLDFPSIADLFYVARERSVFVGMRAHDDMKARKLIDLIQAKLKDRFPGSMARAFQTSLFGRGLSGGRTIDVEITGPELEKLVALGGRIMGQARPLFPENTQMRPIPSLDLSSPEMHVRMKAEQGNALGLSNTELGFAMNALVDGAYAADYFLEGEKIDLVIIGSTESQRNSQDLSALYVATAMLRQPVRLDAIAEMQMSSGPEQINRRERQRAISIEVSPPVEMALEEAIEVIEREILAPLELQGVIGSQYLVNLSGTADKLRLTWEQLRWNFLLAVLITYLLMAALFESWTYPFVIMLSVPLGAVGGILGLRMLSAYLVAIGEPPQALDVLTMLGFVILVGTVVNNAILIVHQSIMFRREGMAPHASIDESLKSRIRPIFMTTLTTIFGLAPLVFFPGAGSELYRGLGAVVFGGLLMSTLLVLVLIPNMLSILVDIELLTAKWFRRASTTQSNPVLVPVATVKIDDEAVAKSRGTSNSATGLPEPKAT